MPHARPHADPSRKPFEVDDLYQHLVITELHGSPTAEQVACVVRSVDRANNTYQRKLWLYPLDGEPGIQVTQGPGDDQTPRWSPDGTELAFVSNRTGAAQLYLMDLRGGEARPLGTLPGGVSALCWTPDGAALVTSVAVPVDPELRGARGDAPVEPRQDGAPEVVWKLPYKSDGIGYLLAREIHLFRVDARTGESTQLTDGAFDVLAHSVSCNGQRVAYVRTRQGRFAHESELWLCDANGNANHERIVATHAHLMQPVWSPSGRYIAFTGAVLAGDAEVRLWLYDTTTGKTSQLGDVEVADPESVHWVEGDQGLVFVRAHRGRHHIARMSLDGQLHSLLERDHQLGAFAWTGRHYAMAVQHPAQPCELHVCATSQCADSFRRISDLNPWWKERMAIHAEPVSFDVPKDEHGGTEQIEGWLIRAGHQAQPAPLLNDIHGGPASYALLDFDSTIYWQVLCSQGWAVLALNAVGSASFGHRFSHELEGHWGTRDMPQHLAAIASLQADGVCDARLAICGKSYGGYLTAWTIGHTEIFKAAVVMAPVGNIETHYGTSDGGYYADPFYMATAPRFDREKARRLSPLQYIEKARTPTLFLQGKEDERTPKCQSEELFVSLMRAGDTPAEMVLYPHEGHSFLSAGAPACREDAANRIISWLTRYALAGAEQPGEAAPPAESAASDDEEAETDDETV